MIFLQSLVNCFFNLIKKDNLNYYLFFYSKYVLLIIQLLEEFYIFLIFWIRYTIYEQQINKFIHCSIYFFFFFIKEIFVIFNILFSILFGFIASEYIPNTNFWIIINNDLKMNNAM